MKSLRIHAPPADAQTPSSDGVVGAIETLLRTLPPHEAEKVCRRFLRSTEVTPIRRGKPVLQLITKTLPEKEEWSAEELRETVKAEIPATNQQIHNAINHLRQRGYLVRIGYGRYAVTEYGFGIEASDEL